MTLYAIRTTNRPRHAGCPASGWVHESRPPWRVIVSADRGLLPSSKGDGTREVVEYTGAEDVVTWDEMRDTPVEPVERVLFAGGPMHGQVLEVYGEPQHYVALESVATGGLWPDDVLHTQVRYHRTTMILDVDGCRYARPVFVDARRTRHGGGVDTHLVQDALVRSWMRDGRPVDPELPGGAS